MLKRGLTLYTKQVSNVLYRCLTLTPCEKFFPELRHSGASRHARGSKAHDKIESRYSNALHVCTTPRELHSGMAVFTVSAAGIDWSVRLRYARFSAVAEIPAVSKVIRFYQCLYVAKSIAIFICSQRVGQHIASIYPLGTASTQKRRCALLTWASHESR